MDDQDGLKLAQPADARQTADSVLVLYGFDKRSSHTKSSSKATT